MDTLQHERLHICLHKKKLFNRTPFATRAVRATIFTVTRKLIHSELGTGKVTDIEIGVLLFVSTYLENQAVLTCENACPILTHSELLI